MAQFRIGQAPGLIPIRGGWPDPGNIIRVFVASDGGLGALRAVFALIAGRRPGGQQSGRHSFAWAISLGPAFSRHGHGNTEFRIRIRAAAAMVQAHTTTLSDTCIRLHCWRFRSGNLEGFMVW